MSIEELKRAKIEIVLAELFAANEGADPDVFATNALYALGVLGWEIVRHGARFYSCS